MKSQQSIYRLRQKHAPRPDAKNAVDAALLLQQQSLPGALRGAWLAALVLIVFWVTAGMMFDRFFPWFSLLQGFFIGRAVRHFGRGIDWRFPVTAALTALVAAFLGSFLCALFLTGREFDTGALALLGELSWHTISTFATREFGVVGSVYAVMSAALAAFFAPRKLTREEAIALRKHSGSRS